MADDPLFSCRIKVERAKEHFNNLHAEYTAFVAREPYRAIVDEDSEPAIKIYKVHVVEEIPVYWSAHIGDIIHNLRSALDNLAMSLVIAKASGPVSEDVMSKSYFPIHGEAGGFGGSAVFALVHPTAEKLIRRLQPYRDGKGHAFWQLHRLDIIDKHRAIIPVGVNLAHVRTADPPNVFYRVPPLIGLKEGDELFRVAFFEPHFDAHAHFAFEVAFGQGQVVDGQPIMKVLQEFIYLVERTIRIFAKYVFRCAW